MFKSGHGKPKDSVNHNHAKSVPITEILSPERALQIYEESGGKLTNEWEYGKDLLAGSTMAEERDRIFWDEIFPTVGSVEAVFGAVSNHNYELLQRLIYEHVHLSEEYFNGSIV